MTKHVYLLVTPSITEGPEQQMKKLGQRYVQYNNRAYRRSGTLWQGRFRSCIAGEDDYMLVCRRYIELKPVRANMVRHPAAYRWSSYQANGQGKSNSMPTPHATYLMLGSDQPERSNTYRELFRYQLDPGVIDEICSSTNGNDALGSQRFREEIEPVLGRRVCPGKSRRPAESELNRGLLQFPPVFLFRSFPFWMQRTVAATWPAISKSK